MNLVWNWMAGSSPAMTAERTANFFTRSFAGITLRNNRVRSKHRAAGAFSGRGERAVRWRDLR